MKKVEHVGLFMLIVDDKERKVTLSEPKRKGSKRDRLSDGELENVRRWALSRAKKYEASGYTVQV